MTRFVTSLPPDLEPQIDMNPLPGDIFARRLRQERERLSISQTELARRIAEILGINVDPSMVNRIEHGTRTVRLDEAVAAAKALDVPLMVLLSDDSMAEHEAQLQQLRVDLAMAQREWEKKRLEVERLLRGIQTLSVDTDLQALLDPRLKDAIDARIPDEDEAVDENADGKIADPGE